MSLKEGKLCPNCGGGKLQKITGYTFEYKGEKLELPTYTYFFCPNCKEDLESAVDNIELDKEITEFMRQIDELLTPKQIKSIRERYGFNQKDFAAILGLGEKTFTRYENGKVKQNRATDNLLRLIKDDPHNLTRVIGYTHGNKISQYPEGLEFHQAKACVGE